LTNLGWVLEAAEVREHLGVEEVILLNDLQAMAYALPALRSEEIEWVQAGRPQEHGVMALIAAGTGLGEGCLMWDDTRWRAYPSEGGHSDFAPVDEEQIALLRFVLREHAHVSYERICSGGLGMPILYRFLKEHLGLKGREVLDEAVMRQDREAARLIVEEATQGGSAAELCQAVLALFVRILGAEAGNLALKLLPTGGLYIGGGLGVRLRSALHTPSFLQPFRAKGRYASMMEEFPVGVILHPMAGLLGAASHALAVESSRTQSL
jgi:glucokinase